MKKVMAFGTFDGLHPGHEAYLTQAKKLGDRLIVVIARDETVQNLKGRPAAHSAEERKKFVEKSGLADEVVIGNLDDKYEVIRAHKPDFIALGYDQFAFSYRLGKFLIDEKLDARVVRLKPFEPTIFKTSLLRRSLPSHDIAA